MHKIGIIGHKTENLQDPEFAEKELHRTLDIITFQYKDDCAINLGGDRGIDLWAGNYCLEKYIKYHLFLPCLPNKFSEFWYDEQKNILNKQLEAARAVTICSSESNIEFERDVTLIDNSSFIICFWSGKKIGRTFEAIKYGLKANKIILDGFDELKLITNSNIKKEG